MRRGSRLVLAILAASLFMTGISPLITPQSQNPCSGCHSNYHQYLDIMEGDTRNILPPVLNDSEYLTIAVMVQNICDAPKYNIMTSVSATLSSQNGYFGVLTPTYNIGALSPGQAARASWQISSKVRGNDALVINAQGANTHYCPSFTDSYSPAPIIFVNKTGIDNPPSISIVSPVSELRLTGGTDRLVSWSASDEDKPNCNVNLYYSTDDFRTSNETVATQLPADQSYMWNLPLIDCSTLRLKASIVDPKGHYSDRMMMGCFTIDSTPPYVVSVEPGDNKKNVSDSAIMVVRFSEPVVKTVSQDYFSMSPAPAWVVWTWNPDQTVMTATHSAFGPGTTYTCKVLQGAKDLSIPGNRLGDDFRWSFTTPSVIVPAPSIVLSSPSGGERYWWGEGIPLRWSASGGTGSLGINLSLSGNGAAGPFYIVANRLPNLGNFSLKAPQIVSDACLLNATAYDQNGLESTASGGVFSIARDLVLNATFPPPEDPILAGSQVDIAWSSSGGHGQASLAIYFQADANSTPEAVAAGLPRTGSYRWTAPEMNIGEARFTVNATDDWNRSVEASSESLTIKTKEPPPPPSPPPPPPKPNGPPVILFNVRDEIVLAKAPATFDASGSFDPDGDTLYFRWDFGDGTDIVNTTGPDTKHTFPYPGEYNVMLVEGDGQNETVQTMTVVVRSVPPAPSSATGDDWQIVSLGIVIMIIGSVGLAYTAVSRPSSRKGAGGQTAGAAAPAAPPAQTQAEAAARAYSAVYGAPPPDHQAAAYAPPMQAYDAQYAAAPPESAPAVEGPPFPLLLDTGRCVGCGACSTICHVQAITMAQNLPMLDCPKCTGCGRCVANCAQGALSLDPGYPLGKAV